jgi:peptide alpha-N-acetyltransferase
MRQKLRKAEAKAKKEAEEKAKEEEIAATAASKGGKKNTQTARPVDTDPDGDKLMHVEDPLSEALKYLRLLQEHSSDALETHVLAFEVYFRKGKKLLALQAVKKQLALDSSSPDVHRCLIRLFESLDKLPSPDNHADNIINDVIVMERASLKEIGEKSLLDANREFLEVHSDSLKHRAAAAEIHLLLCPDGKFDAIKIIEDSVDNEWLLKDCVAVHQLLEVSFKDAEAASKWTSRCAKLFPYSTYFKGAKSSVTLGVANTKDSNHADNGEIESCNVGEKVDTHMVNGGLIDLV